MGLNARKGDMDGHSDKDDSEQRAADYELGSAMYKCVMYSANKSGPDSDNFFPVLSPLIVWFMSI